MPQVRDRHAQLTAVAVGRRRLDRLEQQRPEGAVIDIDAADADRPEGVAVIGVAKGDEAWSLPLPLCTWY